VSSAYKDRDLVTSRSGKEISPRGRVVHEAEWGAHFRAKGGIARVFRRKGSLRTVIIRRGGETLSRRKKGAIVRLRIAPKERFFWKKNGWKTRVGAIAWTALSAGREEEKTETRDRYKRRKFLGRGTDVPGEGIKG